MFKKPIKNSKLLSPLINKINHIFSAWTYRHFVQRSNSTSRNRYPEVFLFVAEYLDEQIQGAATILSYGCSTGEECFSIRDYSADAHIVGLDINQDNLAISEQANSCPNIQFAYSNDENLCNNGPYQAIYAMSVLCRWSETGEVDNCAALYSFSRFEADVERLDKVLQVGGLLVIYNANFRFTDTRISKNYVPLDVEGVTESGFVHKFSKDNWKLEDQTYKQVVFRKKC